jgi:hypothetical protein
MDNLVRLYDELLAAIASDEGNSTSEAEARAALIREIETADRRVLLELLAAAKMRVTLVVAIERLAKGW